MNYNLRLRKIEERTFKDRQPITITYVEAEGLIYSFGNAYEISNSGKIISYIFTGALPQVYFNSLEELKEHYKNIYKETFILRDVKEDVKLMEPELRNLFNN